MDAERPGNRKLLQVRVCSSDNLVDGGPGVRFELPDAGDERLPAFVVRHRGTLSAFLNRCAHVPVELDWLPGAFFDAEGELLVCATHGASYRPSDGRCVGGPCRGRSLRAVPCFESDGTVYVSWPALPGTTQGV